MGKPIVYCVGCGNNLRENDFYDGEAVMLDNRPYCAKCRPKNVPSESPPKAQPAPSAPPPKTSTSRIPLQRPTTARKLAGTGRVPQAEKGDRRRGGAMIRRKYRNWPLIIGGIVLVVAFVLVMLTVLLRRPEPPVPPPEEPPAPTERR